MQSPDHNGSELVVDLLLDRRLVHHQLSLGKEGLELGLSPHLLPLEGHSSLFGIQNVVEDEYEGAWAMMSCRFDR